MTVSSDAQYKSNYVVARRRRFIAKKVNLNKCKDV